MSTRRGFLGTIVAALAAPLMSFRVASHPQRLHSSGQAKPILDTVQRSGNVWVTDGRGASDLEHEARRYPVRLCRTLSGEFYYNHE